MEVEFHAIRDDFSQVSTNGFTFDDGEHLRMFHAASHNFVLKENKGHTDQEIGLRDFCELVDRNIYKITSNKGVKENVIVGLRQLILDRYSGPFGAIRQMTDSVYNGMFRDVGFRSDAIVAEDLINRLKVEKVEM